MLFRSIATAMALGVNALAIDPQSSNTVYAGTTHGLYKSTNEAESWTFVKGELEKVYISSLLVDYRDPHNLYAGTDRGVFKSLDEASSFRPISQGLTNLNVRSLVMHPTAHQVLYAGTNNGIYKTTDGGATWRPLPIMKKISPPQASSKDANERRGG